MSATQTTPAQGKYLVPASQRKRGEERVGSGLYSMAPVHQTRGLSEATQSVALLKRQTPADLPSFSVVSLLDPVTGIVQTIGSVPQRVISQVELPSIPGLLSNQPISPTINSNPKPKSDGSTSGSGITQLKDTPGNEGHSTVFLLAHSDSKPSSKHNEYSESGNPAAPAVGTASNEAINHVEHLTS